MRALQTILFWAVDSGITAHTAKLDARYQRFLNAILLLFGVAQVPIFSLLVVLELWTQLLINLFALGLCGLGFVLNRRGHHRSAKILVVAVMNVNTAYFSTVFGSTVPTHFWLIPGAVLGVLAFKPSEWRWASVLVAVAMVCFGSFEFMLFELEPVVRSFSAPEAELQAAHGSTVAAMMLTLVFVGMMHRRFTRSEVALSQEKAHSSELRRKVIEARRLGQYTLGEKLGEGGMGVVYQASHGMLRRPTAVKLLRSEQVKAIDLARFEHEVQMTAKLTHPNTVTVFDYGRTPENVFYYAMELLEGADLDKLVSVSGPQPPARVRHILTRVADALSEAHDIGLIHRDIKPSNIILCQQGGYLDVPKVVDFGLVHEVDEQIDLSLARKQQIIGTPLYMSPEMIRHPSSIDAKTDLYALGAVGYYLLTGQHVFTGGSVQEICAAHLSAVPIPPEERLGVALPADLQSVVLSCLLKDPMARPQSAAELRRQLIHCSEVGPWSQDDARAWWAENNARLPVRKAGTPDTKESPRRRLRRILDVQDTLDISQDAEAVSVSRTYDWDSDLW